VAGSVTSRVTDPRSLTEGNKGRSPPYIEGNPSTAFAARLIPQYESHIRVTEETIQFVVNLAKEIPHSNRVTKERTPKLSQHVSHQGTVRSTRSGLGKATSAPTRPGTTAPRQPAPAAKKYLKASSTPSSTAQRRSLPGPATFRGSLSLDPTPPYGPR